jgi:E3 ubiquitin-protein ligase TRIP12
MKIVQAGDPQKRFFLIILKKDLYIIVNIQRRKEILLEAFACRKVKGLHPGQTPFATLVKKLQESLTRMESFDVITVTQNSDGKSSSSLSPDEKL